VVTGVGLAVPGLSGPADLLGEARTNGGFDPAEGLRGRDLRHKDRGSRLALRAVHPALADARLLEESGADETGYCGDRNRTAVVVSSNFGVLDNVCDCVEVIARQTVSGLSALGLPQTSINVITGSVAIRYGLRGPNVTLSNGPTGGLDAMYWASTLIRAGRAETVLVVGVEPDGEAVAKLLGAPAADAAAAVVLESAASAAARGVRPRAVVAEHCRAEDPGVATERVLRDSPRLGLWLPPEPPETDWGSPTNGDRERRDAPQSPKPPESPNAPNSQASALSTYVSLSASAARTLRLEWLGRCSGALGVLQCAAAAAYFQSGGRGAVLAVAEDEAASAATAVLFTAPAASEPEA
jgi:3-oxoacyl-[acyl-carrier-protein] synthase II